MEALFSKETATAPDFNIPDSQKTMEWHKRFALHVLGTTVPGANGWYNGFYNNIMMLYQYYYGDINRIPMVNRTTADGTSSQEPSTIAPNGIGLALDTLVSEMHRVYAIPYAQAVNRDAKRKKNEKKLELLVKMRMEAIDREIEALSGEKLIDEDEYIPTSNQELEMFMDGFQLESEKEITRLLTWMVQKYPIKNDIKKLFQELLITNVAAIEYDIQGNNITWSPLMGWELLFDPSPTDDFLSTASWIGRTRIEPTASVLSKYNLTKEQITQVLELSAKQFGGNLPTGWQGFFTFGIGFGSNQDSNMTIRYNPGYMPNQINVTKIYFVDNEYDYYKSSEAEGDEKLKKISEDEYNALEKRNKNRNSKGQEPKYKTSKARRKIIRYCTLIAGCIVPEDGWGVCKQVPRKINNPDYTDYPITAFLPNYKMGMQKSIADKMRPFQELVNTIYYKIQDELSKPPYITVFNDALISQKFKQIGDVMNFIKMNGMLVINPTEAGAQSQAAVSMPPAAVHQTASFQYLMSLWDMLERAKGLMMREVGINEVRLGQQSAEMGYRAQAASLQNAQNSTFYIQSQIITLLEMAFGKFVNYLKLHLKDDKFGESLDLPLGDDFRTWGELSSDFADEDYAVFIKTINSDDLAMLQQTIDLEVQAGNLSAVRAAQFKLDIKYDPIGAIRRLKYYTEESKRLAKEQELVMQEMQMESAREAASMGRETAAMQMQGNLQATQIKEMSENDRQAARLQQQELEQMRKAELEKLRLEVEALIAEKERVENRILEKTNE